MIKGGVFASLVALYTSLCVAGNPGSILFEKMCDLTSRISFKLSRGISLHKLLFSNLQEVLCEPGSW